MAWKVSLAESRVEEKTMREMLPYARLRQTEKIRIRRVRMDISVLL
jgi:hypothetical protein